MIKTKQNGFTLVELLLASVFFSFVLLFATAGFVQVNKAYNKGVTVKRVHETARVIVEDISRSLVSLNSSVDPASLVTITPFIPPPPSPPPPPSSEGSMSVASGTCYRWYTGYNRSARLLKDTDGFTIPCATNTGGVEMVDDRIAIREITIRRLTDTKAYSICVILSSDDNDLTTYTTPSTNPYCAGEAKCSVANGDQYCDTVTLTTVVTLRR